MRKSGIWHFHVSSSPETLVKEWVLQSYRVSHRNEGLGVSEDTVEVEPGAQLCVGQHSINLVLCQTLRRLIACQIRVKNGSCCPSKRDVRQERPLNEGQRCADLHSDCAVLHQCYRSLQGRQGQQDLARQARFSDPHNSSFSVRSSIQKHTSTIVCMIALTLLV